MADTPRRRDEGRVEEADERTRMQRAAGSTPGQPRGRGDGQAVSPGRDERRARPMRGVRRRAIDSDAELESRRERERVDEESE
jgi:hypothetical protein